MNVRYETSKREAAQDVWHQMKQSERTAIVVNNPGKCYSQILAIVEEMYTNRVSTQQHILDKILNS